MKQVIRFTYGSYGKPFVAHSMSEYSVISKTAITIQFLCNKKFNKQIQSFLCKFANNLTINLRVIINSETKITLNNKINNIKQYVINLNNEILHELENFKRIVNNIILISSGTF